MLIIVVLIVSLVIGYALYSNFSTQKQKFTSTDTELSLRNILNLNEDPTELCNLWKNMEDKEEFQITIDGENAAQLSSDKSKPPKTTFDKSSTDALNKIVVDHINKICNSKKPTKNKSKDTNATTTTPPKPTNNAPAPPPAEKEEPAETNEEDIPERYKNPQQDPSVVGKEPPPDEGVANNNAAGTPENPQEDGIAANEAAEEANATEAARAANLKRISEALESFEKNFLETLNITTDFANKNEIELINLKDTESFCEQWGNIVKNNKEYCITSDGNKLQKSKNEEGMQPVFDFTPKFAEITQRLNEICKPPQQQETQSTETEQSTEQPRPTAQSTETQSRDTPTSAATDTQSDQYHDASDLDEIQRREFKNSWGNPPAIEKEFDNEEKDPMTDKLNDIIKYIHSNLPRLGYGIGNGFVLKLTFPILLDNVKNSAFVTMAASKNEKIKEWFGQKIEEFKDKISTVKTQDDILNCLTFLRDTLFSKEGDSLLYHVEEALRVQYLDGVSDGIVSDYDRHRIKMASTEMPNRVMYFGNGEESTDKLIFDPDSVLFNLVQLDRQKNDRIRVQIIEHYGEDREEDCYPDEKRNKNQKLLGSFTTRDPNPKPKTDTFYYNEKNLKLISKNSKPSEGEHFNEFINFDAFKEFIAKIKHAHENLKSHSGKNRIRRHYIDGQSRSHLIVHLFKPGENVPYATIMNIAKAEPKGMAPPTDAITNDPLFEQKIVKNWRDVFFVQGQYKDLSGVIGKVREAIEFIKRKKKFDLAKDNLQDQPISHLYKNENGNFVDLIHGGASAGDTEGDDEWHEAKDDIESESGGVASELDSEDSESNVEVKGDLGLGADEWTHQAEPYIRQHQEILDRYKQEASRYDKELQEGLQKRAESAESRAESAESRAESAQQREAQSNSLLTTMNKENNELKMTIGELQRELNIREANLKAAKVDKAYLVDKTSRIQNEKSGFEQSMNEKETIIRKNEVQIERNNETINTNKEQISGLEEQVKNLKQSEGSSKSDIERLQKDIIALNKNSEVLTAVNGQLEEENEINEKDAAEKEEIIGNLETRISGLDDQIAAKDETIQKATSLLTKAVSNMKALKTDLQDSKKEIEILRGNTEGLAFESTFKESFETIIKFEDNDIENVNVEVFNPTRMDLWNFNANKYSSIFKNDQRNFQLIELHKVRQEIDKFQLEPKKDVHEVIFRAYLYNKLIRNLNEFLFEKELGIRFNSIKKFDQQLLQDLGADSIPKLKDTSLFKQWKKPDQIKFESEEEAFLQIWKKKKDYKGMHNDFIDKVFCPVFHSAKYINRTYPIIHKFISFINGKDNITEKEISKIDTDILKYLKHGSAVKEYTTVVHITFNGGRKFGGGARAMRGGSRYMNFKLSSRSVERIQNVSYYNVVKTIRWRYYLSRKKTEESIEVTIFKDYLFTLIACVFLLAAGNDKLAYGTFTDQLLSIGLFYEFDQDLTALLLPYYLPFT